MTLHGHRHENSKAQTLEDIVFFFLQNVFPHSYILSQSSDQIKEKANNRTVQLRRPKILHNSNFIRMFKKKAPNLKKSPVNLI